MGEGEVVVAPLMTRCAAVLIPRAASLADEIFATIVAEDALYARMGAERRRDVRYFNERTLREQLGCMAEGVPVGNSMARENARRRAKQGVPVDALLHAYRIGYRVVWNAMVAEVKNRPDVSLEEVTVATTSMWSLVDSCSETVNDVYRETVIGLAKADERRRLLLLDALIDGRTAEWNMLGGTGPAIGLPEHGPYVVVAAGKGEGNTLERALLGLGMRSAWRPRADDLVGIVAVPGDPERVLRTVDQAVQGRAGLSPSYGELGGTCAALRLAGLARSALPARTRGATTVDRDPVAAQIAAGPDLAARMVTSVLGPVLDHPDSGMLLESLTVWLETGGSMAEVATRLYCHRNTVRNRLDRVAQLTGRSLQRPADTAALYAAVRALQLGTG